MERTIKKSRASRSKNFTATEVTTLVAEVEKRRHLLFGPLQGPKLTQYHRDRAWEQVLTAVNSVAPVVRKVEELKNKFRDLKARTKLKANTFKREARKTGGGVNDAAPLNDFEQKVISFIGSESIEGITGGIDTFRKCVVNYPTHPVFPSPTLHLEDEAVTVSSEAQVKEMQHPLEIDMILPPPPQFSSHSSEQTPKPIPNASTSACSNPAPAIKTGKKKSKTIAIEEMQKARNLQEETNTLLKDFVTEFRDFKEQFLQIKKRELEIMEENLKENKKRKF